MQRDDDDAPVTPVVAPSAGDDVRTDEVPAAGELRTDVALCALDDTHAAAATRAVDDIRASIDIRATIADRGSADIDPRTAGPEQATVPGKRKPVVDMLATIVDRRPPVMRDAISDEMRDEPSDEPPELDAADHALIAKLRRLPPDGGEPDWNALSAAIHAEVRRRPVHVPWWKRARYLAPLGALAATAGIALVWVKARDARVERTALTVPRDAGASDRITEERENQPRPPAATLWLDGEAVEIDEIEAEALDALEPSVPAVDDDDAPDDDSDDGILPVADYGWIDTLDDDGVARAESWLARNRS